MGDTMETGVRLGALIDQAQRHSPVRTGVVHPVNDISLKGAIEAASNGLIDPILVGPETKIQAAATANGLALDGVKIVDVPHSHAAAEQAVALARCGQIQAIMKGALHTDEIMTAVLAKETGLRTERRVSHVYVMDVPSYPKLLLITDAAINIYPDLEDKRDIVQNAIDLAITLSIETPKVGLLSAVETVYPRIQSTVEAAALCKMADRGQILGGLLDGPLAFDNAISKEAAETKAGNIDNLVPLIPMPSYVPLPIARPIAPKNQKRTAGIEDSNRPADTKKAKRELRLKKNRESANRSRLRKKGQIDALNKKVITLQTENEQLREQNEFLRRLLTDKAR